MKQSAVVLALFLGTTSAVQLRSFGDDKKEVALPPEKVHNLKPTHAQDLSNNLDPEYPTFPQPIGLGAGRTAFYGQTGRGEDDAVQTPRVDVQSVAGPDVTDQIGNSVHAAAMEGGDATPNKRGYITSYAHPESFVPGPPGDSSEQKSSDNQQGLGQVDATERGDDYENTDKRIGEEGYHPWVYKFSYDAMPPVNGFRSSGAGAKTGWHHSNQAPNEPAYNSSGSDTVNPGAVAGLVQKTHRHHHHHKARAQDIGDQGIAEEVQQFANNDKSVLPQPWRRAKEAYPSNGFKNPSFQWLDKKSLVQHHHHHHAKAQDIGDQGIAEEVQQFATADKSVLPQPWRRAKVAYPGNGFLNPSFQWLDKKSLAEHKHHHHHHHHAKAQDIGDEGIVEEVHGFASNDKSVLPQPWRRAQEAYPANGFKNPEFQWLDKKSLVQHHHHHHARAQDIGDQGIAEEVQQFASNDKSVLPQPWRRAKVAYPSNGFKNSSWNWLSQQEKAGRDIGDEGIVEEVHGFASNDKSVLPKPWRRQQEAYPINGFKNPTWQWLDKPEAKAGLVEKSDIGDVGIDEGVHGFASNDNSVLPMPRRRVQEAYPINGAQNPDFQWVKSLAQMEKADIGDKKISEEVHGFVNKDPSMLPKPYPREEHAINGVENPKFQHLADKMDIGNSKYVRPDVYHFVNENIGQVPTYRRKTPPKHKFEAGKSGQGVTIESSGPSGANK